MNQVNWMVLDLRPEKECLTITDGEKVICRIENTVSKNPISDIDVYNANLIVSLANNSDALAEVVKSARSAHATLSDEGFHAKALRLGNAIHKIKNDFYSLFSIFKSDSLPGKTT